MIRRARYLLVGASPARSPRACFQNYVMSETLAQLDYQNERCIMPRFPEQKVTIIGAGSDVGLIVALLLKMQKVVKKLVLYDEAPERGVLGLANDIAHIDTSCEIEAYQGRMYLQRALNNTEVVLICGGSYVLPPCCNMTDRDLFIRNMRHVRCSVQAVAQFAPHAFTALQTAPLDCNFSLAMHTLKMARAYDKRRLLGVNCINAMRATQLYSAMGGTDLASTRIPVVGGAGRCTRVPVFSAGSNVCLGGSVKDCMTRLVREADDIICKVKSNNEQAHLSMGYATARCVINIMTGLFETATELDSAMVEQDDPESCYGLQICCTPVKIGQCGIEAYNIPKLNESEQKLLDDAKCEIEDMINLGRCYAVGDDYYVAPCQIPPPHEYKHCTVVQP